MSEPELLDRSLLKRFPLPHHADDGDKEDRGRILVIGGSRELPGAALLAGVAALRAGAGKLRIATAASVATPIAVAIPEARVVAYAENDEGCISPEAVESLVKAVKEVSAVTVGCGLQHGEPLEHFLDSLFACEADIPLVLDAAVLGSLPERSEALKAWSGGAALLPHAGEMARLLGCSREDVAADPASAAREAAETFRAVALIKGEYSHIVAPDGSAFRYRGGGVGLATSGSGDALAGLVGGLCARGADPLTATLWGVYLHGEAGRILSAQVGRIGFLARELLPLVPRLMQEAG